MRFASLKTCLFCTALLFSSANVNAEIEFWHSNLTWAGQGKCSAEFTFDSGFEEIESLKIQLNLVSETGEIIGTDSLQLNAFGESNASRYQQAFIENEEICDDSLQLVVTQAIAKISGQPLDLLKTNQISTREFKPLKIQLPTP